MSTSPATTFSLAISTCLECGHLGSVTIGVIAVQSPLPSCTCPVTSVGQVGSVLPDFRIGVACHTICEAITPSHVTWLSVTGTPTLVGQVGSVAALLPGAACVAL